MAVAAVVAVVTLFGQIGYGQAAPVFEVTRAPNVGGPARTCGELSSATQSPQRIVFKSWRLGDIIAFAHDLPFDRVERQPQWMYEECYDLAVTTAVPVSLVEQKQMVLALLGERFGLVAHRVSYPSRVYFLLRGSTVKLTEAATDASSAFVLEPQLVERMRSTFYAQHASIGDLAVWLSRQLQVPVLDRTEITGTFDITLRKPVRITEKAIVAALRDSLGLDLEIHQGTAESLLIDRVEKPRF